MVNTTFVSFVLDPALYPALEGIPDNVLIEFAAYVRRCGIQELKIKRQNGCTTAICKKGKLKAHVAISKDGFRVVKIYC